MSAHADGPPPALVAKYDQITAGLRVEVREVVDQLRSHDEACPHDYCGMAAVIVDYLEDIENDLGGSLVHAVELFAMAAQMLADAETAREEERT